jgi:hypothetical protein
MSGELDRATAERVMARAMELAGAESVGDAGSRRGLTPEQLTAIGAELGIDEGHVRRALAEVLATPPRVRALDRSVSAARHIELPPADCERILAAWFEGPDGLRALRRTGPELAIWAPRSGVVAGARYAIARAGGADLDLREAKDVRTVIEPVGEDGSVVRLEARVKRDYAAMAGVVGGGGTVVAVGAAAVLWWPLVAGIPVALAAGYGFLRAQRSESELVALALERRLDAVGQGREPAVRSASLSAALVRVREVATRARGASAKR